MRHHHRKNETYPNDSACPCAFLIFYFINYRMHSVRSHSSIVRSFGGQSIITLVHDSMMLYEEDLSIDENFLFQMQAFSPRNVSVDRTTMD
jgi:hypothetical protein